MGKRSHEILPGLYLLLQLLDILLQNPGHLVEIQGQISQLVSATFFAR